MLVAIKRPEQGQLRSSLFFYGICNSRLMSNRKNSETLWSRLSANFFRFASNSGFMRIKRFFENFMVTSFLYLQRKTGFNMTIAKIKIVRWRNQRSM